jgi:hypothetical protein
MHNLTVPSVLKAWLDHVVRARRTFDAQTRIAADVALQDHFSVRYFELLTFRSRKFLINGTISSARSSRAK